MPATKVFVRQSMAPVGSIVGSSSVTSSKGCVCVTHIYVYSLGYFLAFSSILVTCPSLSCTDLPPPP